MTSPTTPIMARIKSILAIRDPITILSESLLSSGQQSPRMHRVRKPEVNAEDLITKLEELRIPTHEEWKTVPVVCDGTSSDILPHEILKLIMRHVGKLDRLDGSFSGLLACSYVNKRFNAYANIYLWRQLDINTEKSMLAIINIFKDSTRSKVFGSLVNGMVISGIRLLDHGKFKILLDSCRRLKSLCLEKCAIIEPEPAQKLNQLVHLTTFVISDCPLMPASPIMAIFQMSPNLKSLNITGCNFNEDNMVDIIARCPKLTDIKLGSHTCASITSLGSSGGNQFAEALAKNCKQLKRADLTSIVALRDEGFAFLVDAFKDQLERLVLRRAMQVSLPSLYTLTQFRCLRTLVLANIPHLDDETAVKILECLGDRLKFLQLEALPIADETVRTVSTCCVQLRHLRIYDCMNWRHIKSLLDDSKIRSLVVLVIHGCLLLDGEEPTHPESSPIETSPQSPLSSEPKTDSDGDNLCLSLLEHLEIAGCNNLQSTTISTILSKCNSLSRFIYVGEDEQGQITAIVSKKGITSDIHLQTPN